MKICIIGAGVVGSYLANKLVRDGYEVAIIDLDGAKLESISNRLDVLAINCNAFDIRCLENVRDFDLYIVVTDKEETNFAIGVILRALLKKERIIVRANSNVLSAPPIKELVGIDVVNTTAEIISNITDIIHFPFALSVSRFEKGKLFFVKYEVETEDVLSGRQLCEFKALREKVPFTVAAIERDDKVIIPHGNTTLYPGDRIYMAVRERDVKSLFDAFSIKHEPVKLIFVLGYSSLVPELLKRIKDIENIKIKFVSPDADVCGSMAGQFPEITVLHGEVTNAKLLGSEGISEADMVISLTDDEEDNILSCILGKRLGARKAIALIAHPEYESIVESIGIDSPIVPRKLIASRVYKNLSHKGLVEILELRENIEIFEIEVPEKLDGKQLSDVSSKDCPLTLGIKRHENIEIAVGNTVLKKGDILICIREI